MKIAVVGNREGWNWETVESKLEEYIDWDDEIVTGGAIGVDTFAREFAELKGLKVTVFAPDTKIPSPQRYFERNQKIVDYSDILIAFQNKEGHSGTAHTVKIAMEKGKPVTIISPFHVEKYNQVV